MRILFSVRNSSYVRHYDSVLRMLAERGHEVDLSNERPGDEPWPPSVLALAQAYPNLRLSTLPDLKGDPWWELATRLRQGRFYLRFLDRVYRDMPALAARARDKAPPLSVRIGESPVGRSRFGRRLLVRVLDLLDQATRTSARFHDFLRDLRPDVVIVTPLVVLKTAQLDLARAALELGVRNIFAVASWDHLSSKGELTFHPQRILAWNDVQRQEAATLHGLDAARVVVTGSQVFDDWFDKQPSLSREAFCARVGLRRDQPFVLYVCSALLEGSPPEHEFVLRWVQQLRHSGHPILRECGILVRPHFKRGEPWRGLQFTDTHNVVCWPPAGAVPVDAASKNDYFDSMHHSAAVVGLNTSAMIEAGIVGRPVHTVLLPEFRGSQEGTLHFHYLLDGPNALLRATRSLDAHAADVAAILEGRDEDPDRSGRFVRTFVRPHGLDVRATTRVVEAIEALGAQEAPAAEPAPRWTAWVRPALAPFATAAAERIRRLKDEHRQRKEQQLIEHRRRRRAAEAVARGQDAP